MIRSILKRWFPLVTVIFLLGGLCYGMAFLMIRQTANDPQWQMAQDAAVAMELVAWAGAVVPGNSIDMLASPSPFMTVFDAEGKPLSSSGRLHRKAPAPPPAEFLDEAREHGECRFTWELEGGVRIAAVIVRSDKPELRYVLVGKSLKETDRRIRDLTILAGSGMLFILIVSLLMTAYLESGSRKKESRP